MRYKNQRKLEHLKTKRKKIRQISGQKYDRNNFKTGEKNESSKRKVIEEPKNQHDSWAATFDYFITCHSIYEYIRYCRW